MTRDPLVIPTAHIVSLLTARARPTEGRWPTVEAMERGRRWRRLGWNLAAGAFLLGLLALVAGGVYALGALVGE